MKPAAEGLREALSRNALGLWFCAIAALGVLRCWMKVVREGEGPWPPDLWPWIVGTGVCTATGVTLLLRERGRRARDSRRSR